MSEELLEMEKLWKAYDCRDPTRPHSAGKFGDVLIKLG